MVELIFLVIAIRHTAMTLNAIAPFNILIELKHAIVALCELELSIGHNSLNFSVFATSVCRTSADNHHTTHQQNQEINCSHMSIQFSSYYY